MDVYQQILLKYWGYPNFRPLQAEIIKSVTEGKDTLALMPTGGGKSITFQVPALSADGICIVITPLISLMKDQVENLHKRGIKAVAIYSGMSHDEIQIALDNCTFGKIKFLYLSPERLGTESLIERLPKMKVNLVAVDEAHCISQWGYDFRPSYLKIAEIRNYLPGIAILALTATATRDVVIDIQEKLLFREKNVLQYSFERKNLVFIVRNVEDKQKKLLEIINNTNGSGIIYCRNRKRTKEIAELLLKNNISAEFYHAGMDNDIRNIRQNDWKNNKFRVIVCTNAFGMGIDKPDVRFVIHIDVPETLEEYFQEAGRAGRDERTAFAVLLINESDKIKLQGLIRVNFPEISTIKSVYESLCNYFQVAIGSGKSQVFDFNISDFASTFRLETLAVFNSMKFLQYEGYIEFTEELDNPSRIHFRVNREQLYEFQVSNIKFDNFIKLILRSFTGLFSDYVRIDESLLARRADTSEEIVRKYLLKLDEMAIISYIPRKKTPLLIFTDNRVHEKSLIFSHENYNKRKVNYINKVNAVIDYYSSNSKCRSEMLLIYFGEKNTYRCGKCDICTKRNELGLSSYEFDLILNKAKELLRIEPLLLDILVDRIDLNKQKVLKVIRWLLDNNKIIYSPENKMTWHN